MPVQVTPASSVHMLWLVPQYFVMTIAEVMFSVTGLQFSFTQVNHLNAEKKKIRPCNNNYNVNWILIQAPASMQSVMQAAWLLTIAFGNLIVILVAEAKGIPRQVQSN
jgi:solute carrier family 15 oligopeptide transporter 1